LPTTLPAAAFSLPAACLRRPLTWFSLMAIRVSLLNRRGGDDVRRYPVDCHARIVANT
jgi:hypothetical protein